MSVIEFPTRGLTSIDIRIVKVVSVALGWEVEIGRSAESEAFALITPRSYEDIVFTLMKEQGEYVLTKYGYYPEPPYELARGPLEIALVALPRSLASLI
jgi:hypothetical protein